MRVLITGITGMLGREFARVYKENGYGIFGIARNPVDNLICDQFYKCDITDKDGLETIVQDVKPDLIIHMAAQVFNAKSWECEFLTHETNYIGSLKLIRAANKLEVKPTILLACSACEYGDVSYNDIPIRESLPLKAISPYGVSKIGMEMLAQQYIDNYGMKIFLPRMFTHLGIGHPTAMHKYVDQLVKIKKGLVEPIIYADDLDTIRDFIDVRDGVQAMLMVLASSFNGVPVNICSGIGYKYRDLLNVLIEIANVNVKIIEKDSQQVSNNIIGENSRLKSLGWNPKYSIKESFEFIFDYYMNIV